MAKLSDLKRGHEVKILGGKALVRPVSEEYLLRLLELDQESAITLGIEVADLPAAVSIENQRTAAIDAELLAGWSGYEHDDDTPIIDRHPDGALHRENALLLLRVTAFWIAFWAATGVVGEGLRKAVAGAKKN